MTTSLLPHARELVRKRLLDPESGQLLEMVRTAREGVRDQGGARWVLERLKGGGHVIVRAAPDSDGKPAVFILSPEDEDQYERALARVRDVVAKEFGGPLVAGETSYVALAHLAGQGPRLLKRLASGSRSEVNTLAGS